jgi:hypothetical protein
MIFEGREGEGVNREGAGRQLVAGADNRDRGGVGGGGAVRRGDVR